RRRRSGLSAAAFVMSGPFRTYVVSLRRKLHLHRKSCQARRVGPPEAIEPLARARPTSRDAPRVPLSRERVLDAAFALADEIGVESLSMRRLAKALGVEAMSLYNHVGSKDDLLDGLVDLVFEEIEPPPSGVDWRTAMRRRAVSTREALRRHPWAIGLMEARSQPGPSSIALHEAVLKTLREAGFSLAETVHAYSVQDAYIYGFALQERALPS